MALSSAYIVANMFTILVVLTAAVADTIAPVIGSSVTAEGV
jgi:hypothetical protein